jgi:hypothetical protein
MELSFPTDSDGFLSRECPSCDQLFKVLPGQGSDQPVSHCPHCGHTGSDCWNTSAQVDYAKSVVANTLLVPEIERLRRQLGASSGFLKITLEHNIDKPPAPPIDADVPFDIIRFPCCNETVKLSRNETNFCIICGTPFEMKLSDSKRVFLSHKGADKAKVVDFKQSLELMGFSPWLDEDAMPAGTSLERGILQGMQDSCAVVFFITPAFKDAGYLETEVNYAIQEKRKKGDRFAIIALQFADASGKAGDIPELLKPYVWKHPKSDLEALREILRAVPVVVGTADWREGIAGVVASPKIKSTVSELSEEAKAILIAAAKAHGQIHYMKYMGGRAIQAGGKSLIPNNDPRTVALWKGGLEDLQRRRFIQDLGHKGEVFEVTREGYEAADLFGKEQSANEAEA